MSDLIPNYWAYEGLKSPISTSYGKENLQTLTSWWDGYWIYLTDFEAAVTQMLQQASLNTPETNEKTESLQINR